MPTGFVTQPFVRASLLALSVLFFIGVAPAADAHSRDMGASDFAVVAGREDSAQFVQHCLSTVTCNIGALARHDTAAFTLAGGPEVPAVQDEQRNALTSIPLDPPPPRS